MKTFIKYIFAEKSHQNVDKTMDLFIRKHIMKAYLTMLWITTGMVTEECPPYFLNGAQKCPDQSICFLRHNGNHC